MDLKAIQYSWCICIVRISDPRPDRGWRACCLGTRAVTLIPQKSSNGRPATPDVAIGDARGHYLRETSNSHGHDNVTVIHIGRSAIHVQLTGAVGILE